MAGPIAIDTPDYQRGLVSAQKLLATVPAGTDHVTVGVPPNAETLIVTASNVGTNPTVYVEGTGTLYKFPGKLAIQQPFITSAPTWFFDVSQSVDSSVLVQFSAAPGEQWYVYADSAAHLVVDSSKRVDGFGQQYVIPSLPSVLSGDHPTIELSLASGDLTGSGTMIAAPGASQRLRIFALALAGHNAAGEVLVENGPGGTTLLPLLGIGPAILPVPLTGYPLSVNTALYMTVPAYGALWSAYYTTENV